jgi:hypothetical protein
MLGAIRWAPRIPGNLGAFAADRVASETKGIFHWSRPLNITLCTNGPYRNEPRTFLRKILDILANDGSAVRPSAFAVFKLITSSNVVGCWTGRSLGSRPLGDARGTAPSQACDGDRNEEGELIVARSFRACSADARFAVDSPLEGDGFEPSVPGPRNARSRALFRSDRGHYRRREAHDPQHQQRGRQASEAPRQKR